MKKVVLILAVLFTALTSVNAQKGTNIVSGTVSYTKATDVKASNLSKYTKIIWDQKIKPGIASRL